MENETTPEQEAAQDAVVQEDTRHEAHEHAHKRLFIGLGAVAAVLIVGGIVWAQWGDKIYEACFGETACAVEIDPALLEGGVEFDAPDPESFDEALEEHNEEEIPEVY